MIKRINKGISDIPITEKSEDCFGLSAYVDGLSEFIQICETPMTIAVQGDWGCGKTSMLNMVRGAIEGSVKTIWFNTWQYSKFHMDENLTLAFLARLSSLLNDDSVNKKTTEKLAVLARAGVKVGSYIIDILGAQKLADDISEIGHGSGNTQVDAVKVIEELKADFQEAINNVVDNENKRVVIFIDDLDRLSPEKAVDLMEILKLFLDCKNCVFVLAIDYDVVVRGIEEKYGKDFGKEQGKKFFDKIIQVPFLIPVERYDITQYIKKSMPSIVKMDKEDEDDYKYFIQHSIGTNPRSMKRLFNTFLLLTTINRGRGFEYDTLAQKLLFAVICMQLSMEEAYHILVENIDQLSKEFLSTTINVDEKATLFLNKVIEVLCQGSDDVKPEVLEKMKDALSISSSTNNVRIETSGKVMELNENKTIERTIGLTEEKYKIITLGSSMHVGFGKEIVFVWNDISYNVKMHRGVKGRIDGLSKFYSDSGIREGDVLQLDYDYERNQISCKKI